MVLDYSKWDALELSDDSDIETHPNVDKRSFIRAKQNQIHQERLQRKHRIETLKYERVINDGLLSRIDKLLSALRGHQADADDADELVFETLIDITGNAAEDTPPKPSEEVYKNVQEQPTYSKMMASLVDQVKQEVDKSKTNNRYTAYIEVIKKHHDKVSELQGKLIEELRQLEKDASRHITSDDIHTGFDSSHVSKASEKPSGKTSSVELLNPGATKGDPLNAGQSSGADADIEAAVDEAYDEDDPKLSKDGARFAKISFGDYSACQRFIHEHPNIMTTRESEALLVEAFNALTDGKSEYGRQCIHQALLIQYCRQLPGSDAVGMFFKRITTPDHNARKLFLDDVHSTYTRISARTAELARERASASQEEVETIQLHAVDPSTSIAIQVPPPFPPPASSNISPNSEEYAALKNARDIFDSFSPGLRKALEKGSLEEVNKVLAKMSVEEAEGVVEKLGEGGMLSLEKGVIDATTEEGKRRVEAIERDRRLDGDGRVEEIDEEEGEEGLVQEVKETRLEDTVD
ncbi:MAG: hsp90 co-chaperone Cdc37 [Bogoriella megaspora]|nr:MAG: hsp90 co-chaperone Cdc37 [Bogoriella megaspora]